MAKVNCVRYSITFAFFVLINIEVSTSGESKNFACDQVGSCCYKFNDDLIDLSPLENYTRSEQGFLTVSNNQSVYFYHPCSDVSVPTANTTECSKGCSLCLFKADKQTNPSLSPKDVLSGRIPGTFSCLATAGQAVFQRSETEIHLIYKSQNIIVIIKLECAESNTVLSLRDANVPVQLTTHMFVLSSPYSCFQNISHNKHYMSGFGVFCLVLLILSAAYFFGGMLILRCIKGARGTEMIPNYDFWVSVPRRIKNGFNRCLGRGSAGPDGYESI